MLLETQFDIRPRPPTTRSTSPDHNMDYYDLGSFHKPVSTTVKEAQVWFDRGLIWSYGYNHEEAAHCFEKAIASDAECAMAYWGLALVLGPNYNKPWEAFDEEEKKRTVSRCHKALASARALLHKATDVEGALINALEYRYPSQAQIEESSIWNQKYAKAMENVYYRFGDDLDVAALYAEALMNLTPWQLWDLKTGQPATGARTSDAKAAIEKGLGTEVGANHPGLMHLYIHLMEMSGTPETALTVADNLRGLVPDSGHLNHMPTHLDILCGDYRRAIASNSQAILADKIFLAKAGPLNFYTLYRLHNYHFRIYAAMFSGQSKIALQTISEVEVSVPEDLLLVKSPPMADWLEAFLGMRVHILIRFGMWQDLIDLKLPLDQALYCTTTALMHYGKGVAFAATGNIKEAEKEQSLFGAAVDKVPESRTLFNNKCVDILAVAAAMLEGEIAYRQESFDDAFGALKQAIELEDSLPFDEPWGWMQPTRHAYGALLLEQGHLDAAADIYAADLGFDSTLPRPLRHPNNVWSLHGYHECLTQLGRDAEARIIEPQLRLALAIADVPIQSSCFCRIQPTRKCASMGNCHSLG
jgi:tetratricopeptide (TPR) repeat protein